MTSAAGLQSAQCRNCDSPLGDPPGNYCSHCGQDTSAHPPSIFEFVHEFAGHYVALEGPLVRTLGLLFFRPGELTREYLKGRKRRYVLPLRLYLTISLVFFLLLGALTPEGNTNWNLSPADTSALKSTREEVTEALKKDLTPEAAAKVEIALNKVKPLDKGKAIGGQSNKVGNINWESCSVPWLCPRLKHRFESWNRMSSEDFADAMKTRALHTAPIAMFVLLPLYALLLQIVYFNRRMYFGEHLVFSFHLHSFMFLVLMATLVPVPWLKSLLEVWLLVYPIFALKRVYGGGWFGTLVRSALIVFLYALALVPALLVFSALFLAA